MKPASSLKNFPPDLLIASGIPFLAFALLSGWIFHLRGPAWIIAFSASLGVAVLGAVLLFRAKLPLYRQGRFLTIGAHDLPPSSQKLYRQGIRLAATGCVLAALLILASCLWG